jgi:hypothetical protein
MTCITPTSTSTIIGEELSGALSSGPGVDPATTEAGKMILSLRYGDLVNFPLSKNFSVKHFTDIGTSVHLPQNNSANQIVLNMLGVVTNILEPIVDKWGRGSFDITHGLRGGSGTSDHYSGAAIDIRFKGGNRANFDKACELIGVGGKPAVLKSWKQVIYELGNPNGAIVHCAWKLNRNKGEYFCSQNRGSDVVGSMNSMVYIG